MMYIKEKVTVNNMENKKESIIKKLIRKMESARKKGAREDFESLHSEYFNIATTTTISPNQAFTPFRLTFDEIQSATKVSHSTLARYIKAGLLYRPNRVGFANGKRGMKGFYHRDTIVMIKKIQELTKKRGFTLKEIKEKWDSL